MTDRPKNRLAHETSPYLLQHASNPVDWYAWGDEALARAKREDKPIFLSIGYSACHWCHVMERESFEDEEVARALAEGFVSIKVDREERPDLDAVYMTATVAMSGSGGWPMSVFLTPDGEPFFAGTYFPKTSRYGRPGFLEVVRRIHALWSTEREELLDQARQLSEAVRAEAAPEAPRGVDARAPELAAAQLMRTFDERWGGFGGAPKFPAPAALSLLLRQHAATNDPALLDAVTTTLDRMARGGIYDHVGGGFARYSTDERWHVPHFEKMLYDNAQLARVYAEAWQVTADPRWRAVAEETLGYVMREMQGDSGGYFSATDADSEGEEGKFFVWSLEEIERVLTAEEAESFCALYDVRARGNWEAHNVLWMPRRRDDVATDLGLTVEVLERRAEAAKKKLYAVRQQRPKPLLDDKVLVSWNALMIGAMAFAGRVFGRRDFVESAARAAAMIRARMTEGGRLKRTFRDGRAHIEGFLEDYAYLADALVDLYEAAGDEAILDEALRLAEHARVAFATEDGAGFYTTSLDHEALIVRMRDTTDNATPSAGAVLARALSRLAAHFGRDDLRAVAEAAVRANGRSIARAPRAFATTLDVLCRLVAPPVEVALVGTPGDAALAALDRELGRTFLPGAVIARLDPSKPTRHPLLEGKSLVGGAPAAFVCRSFSCDAPVTDAESLSRSLRAATSRAEADKRPSLDAPRLGTAATAEATRAFVKGKPGEAGALFDLTVGRTGVLVASYREKEIGAVVARAISTGKNLIAFDRQRATAVGDAIEGAIGSGSVERTALVLAALLPTAEPADEVVRMARAVAAEVRVEHLDVLLVPVRPSATEPTAEALARLAQAGVATHLGVVLDETPTSAELPALLERLPPSAEVVCAPFNLIEGERDLPRVVRASGRAFLALRPLDPRVEAGGKVRVVPLSPQPTAADLPPAPDLASTLASLLELEKEYRARIAPHLGLASSVVDRNALLAWASELGRAETVIDDLMELDAFMAQSVMPALRSHMAALEQASGTLRETVSAFSERYLVAVDLALKALARHIAERTARAEAALAASAGVPPKDLARRALGAVLAHADVTATLLTARISPHVDTTPEPLEDGGAALDRVRGAR